MRAGGFLFYWMKCYKTMYPSNFRKNFLLLVRAPANQQTKWRQMTADINWQFAMYTMYRRFFNMNTGNAIKIFGAGGLKVTRAVPEKHIINYFWPNGWYFSTNLAPALVLMGWKTSSRISSSLSSSFRSSSVEASSSGAFSCYKEKQNFFPVSTSNFFYNIGCPW